LVEALRRRRDAGTAPFTVMSCDNLPGNGDVARHAVTTFAAQRDPELAGWIEEEVAFPNAMVDRITPVTTDEDRATVREQLGVDDGWPVVCEPFTQWVLEDHFVDGRPPVEEVGAQLVDDVEPYELMKLRLLNASHQALCYLGYLSGHRYAHEVCNDEDFVTFLQGYMRDEGRPTLPEVPGVDLQEYSDTLVERFANPQIRDTLARLCAESSDRIPKWLLPVVRHNLEHGGEISRSALVVAAWARYAEGVDEQGQPIEVVDHRRDRVLAAAQAQLGDDPLAFLRDAELFGDLAQDERFTSVYLEHLEVLHRDGAREAVRRVNTQQ
ncbi:mannitol dehydrogenase family protein, partial [Janibacter melonis]|uniref:mannitol dehydrogenase family protein n=1 Tax=Janibacter melonis TaxID=262209 RepID=UPI002094EBE5